MMQQPVNSSLNHVLYDVCIKLLYLSIPSIFIARLDLLFSYCTCVFGLRSLHRYDKYNKISKIPTALYLKMFTNNKNLLGDLFD